jgi:Aspartyl protease
MVCTQLALRACVLFRRLISILTLALLLCANRLFAATPIPFEFRDGMIWLKVAVAGRGEPLYFLLDSGAGASVLDLAAAQRLGLKLGSRQNVQGVHSRSIAYRVDGLVAHAASVAIPSSLLAVDLSGPSRGCHQRIDGLLGADFFRNRIVQIDFAAQTIRLLQRDEVNPSGCEILPLTARNDTLCARISVDGNAPEWLRLDTGCNSTLEWVVTGNKAKKLGIPTLGFNSGSVREFHTDVQLGSKRIGAVKTGIHTEQMFAGEAGLIGNGLLSQFTVTIDASKRRCLLSSR